MESKKDNDSKASSIESEKGSETYKKPEDVPRDILQKEINAILKEADLSKTSAKKVRQTLEAKLSVSLLSRRKEVDELVMDFVNSKDQNESEEEDGSDEEQEEEEEKPKTNKRPAVVTKTPPAKKQKKDSSNESEPESGEKSEDDKMERKPRAAKKVSKPRRAVKKAKGSGSDSEEAPKAKRKGNNGFTRPYTLSPELANFMGAETAPRHEVVKKVWQMIKERNLYDQKNKQYAICDDELMKVMGVKRFRTFGMLKYLRNHFRD